MNTLRLARAPIVVLALMLTLFGFVAATPAAAQLVAPVDIYPVAANCRAYDSRRPGDVPSGPLSPGTVHTVTLAGECGVPPEADGVVLSVGVFGAMNPGSLAVFPAGITPPGAVPLVDAVMFDGANAQGVPQNRAKTSLVSFGPGGEVSFRAQIDVPGSTYHVFMDVTGYFTNAEAWPDAMPPLPAVLEDAAATPISVLTNDIDPDDPLAIASATDPVNGTVTLTGGTPGSHTGLDYQPDPDYCNTPPGTTLDTFIYTLSAGSFAQVNVTVTCVNDAPELTAGGVLSYAENDPPTAIDTTITVDDIDDVNLESATVQITDGFESGEDVLSFVNTATITAAPFDTVTGTLTLTGSDTLANWQAALRSVRYENTSNFPSKSPRTVTWIANDGDDPSAAVTSTISLGGSNDAPTISAIADQTINEDASTGPLAFTVDDAETAAASLTVTGTSSDQTLVPDANIVFGGSGANRTVTVTPAANQFGGPVTITITVNDGSGQPNATATETFDLTITGENDQPTITAIADQTIDEDTSTGPLAFTIGDQETAAGTLTVTATSSDQTIIPDANVVLGGSGTSRTVTVTPAANQSGGPVTITITVNDGSGAPNATNTETFDVTVNAVNDQPTITGIANQTIDEDTSTGALAFTIGDEETAAGTLTVSGTSSDPTRIPNGNIVFGGSGASRTVTVTPAANQFGGPVTITVTVNDGSGAPNATNTTTFDVTINAVNDQPTVTAIANQTIDEDTSTGPLAFTVGDEETAPVALTVTATSSNQALVPDANVVLGGSGASRTVTVTPVADQSGGPVTITITVNDGSGAPNASSTTTFDVTVNAVNDQPTITGIANQTIDEDTSTAPLAFTIGDIETAPGTLTVSGTSSDPTRIPNANIVFGGSGASRTVTVTPAANQFGGPVTITVTVNDGSGAPNATNSTTFTVTINSVNDQPTITGIANQTIDEDTTTGPLAFTIGDVETAAGSLSVSGTSSNGTIIPNGNIVFGGSGASRTVTVTPALNQFGGPVTITITVDDGSAQPNSTNSTIFTVTVNPVNDAPTVADASHDYTVLGNTQLRVGEATNGNGVLHLRDNQDVLEKSGPADVDGPLPFDAIVTVPPTNGQVTFNGDGTFRYEPNPGFEGTDTFTVRVRDAAGAQSVPVTVNLIVSQMVWYVRDVVDADNPAAGDDGRSTNAFEVLGDVEPVVTDNDFIFVFEGNTGTTPLDGGIDIDNTGVKLHGQGVGLTVPGHGTLIPAGNRPRITNVGAAGGAEDNGVNVIATGASLSGIEIRGLNVSGRDNAIDVNATGANNAAVTISDNTISNDGTNGLEGVDVNAAGTGMVTVTASNNTLSARGNAFDARTLAAGVLRVDFSNHTNILSSLGSGVVIDGSFAGSSATITGFANNTVHQNTAGMGISVTSATFDGTPGGTFQTITGGSTVVGASGDGVGTSAMVLTNVQGDLSFTDLDLYASNGAALRASSTTGYTGSAGLRLTVGSNVGTFNALGGPAVDITTATIDLQLANLTSATPTSGVSLTNVAGTFTVPTSPSHSITKSSGGGAAFSVDNSAAGTTVLTSTYGGTINNSSSTGRSVSINNADSGSSASFAGQVTDNPGQGVTLTANTGATISFSGGLTLSTSTSTGFNATGGGTVTVTDPVGATNNTITTTTGTALNVNATTIGASGFTFERISAGTSGSPANGIVLNNTGSGALTVTGTGSAGSGGTINSATGAGISLTNTGAVNLSHMNVQNGGDDGIRGSGVNGLNLTSLNVSSNGNAVGEHGIEVAGLTGSGGMTNCTVTGSAEHNVSIANTSGTLSAFNVTNSSFTNTNMTTGSDGFLLENNGTGSMSVSITGSTFTDNKGDHFQAATFASTTGSIALTFSNNTLTTTAANDPNVVGGGITISPTGSADVTFTINNNNIQQAFDEAININLGGASTAASSLTGTISTNTIGTAGDVDSGSESGSGINVASNGAGVVTVAVTNNQVRQYANPYGIVLAIRDGSTSMNATVTGNTVANPGSFAINGIRVDAGATAGDNGTLCAAVSGNSVAGSGPAADTDIRLRQRFNTTIRLPGYGGGNSDTTAVNSFVAGNNAGSDVSSAHNVGGGGNGYVGGAACPLP